MAESRDVSPSGNKWIVTAPGRRQPISEHRTQEAAERAAKEDLARHGGGEVRIRRPDGSIRDSDTVAPGRDPNPPRDTRH